MCFWDILCLLCVYQCCKCFSWHHRGNDEATKWERCHHRGNDKVTEREHCHYRVNDKVTEREHCHHRGNGKVTEWEHWQVYRTRTLFQQWTWQCYGMLTLLPEETTRLRNKNSHHRGNDKVTEREQSPQRKRQGYGTRTLSSQRKCWADRKLCGTVASCHPHDPTCQCVSVCVLIVTFFLHVFVSTPDCGLPTCNHVTGQVNLGGGQPWSSIRRVSASVRLTF